jgi:hypothetical protein
VAGGQGGDADGPVDPTLRIVFLLLVSANLSVRQGYRKPE